ncbi:MAG: MATE family efflux transporter, partial [Treponema sp.]|nr:MATE family efflux transporter [Treponema sp.]
MAQLWVQNLVSLIDNFMVAGLGDVKMSGVNISGQIIFLFIVLLGTICTAAGIFMTQFSGAEDKDGMRQS